MYDEDDAAEITKIYSAKTRTWFVYRGEYLIAIIRES